MTKETTGKREPIEQGAILARCTSDKILISKINKEIFEKLNNKKVNNQNNKWYREINTLFLKDVLMYNIHIK